MEQALTSDARPIPEHVVDGLVRFDHAGLLTEEDRREMIRRFQLYLLRPRCERPRHSRAAERDQQFPPSDSDCHTPLPCEVRKNKDTTPRACSLRVQGGQDAGCFHLSRQLQLHYSRRQLFANAAIAASRVAA